MKRVKSLLLLFLAFVIGQCLVAQTLPIIGTVPPKETENIISGGLSDGDSLIIQNTGTVPLKFCLGNNTAQTCIGSPTAVDVGAGETRRVSVGQLGGVTLGGFFNVTNDALTIGVYSVIKAPSTTCPSPDPSAWQNAAVTTAGNKLFLCPLYSYVGIGVLNPTSTLDVSGTQKLTGDFTQTGSTYQTGNFNLIQGAHTISGSELPNKLVLNSTGSSKKSQMSFQHNGSESWAMGVDPNNNGSNGFFIYKSGAANNFPISISNAGKIGIQNTNPDAQLDIIGGPLWTNSNWSKGIKLANAMALEFYTPGTKYGIGATSSTNSLHIFTTTGDANEAALYRFVMNSNGNIGINADANDSYKLSVNGPVRATKVVIETGWADYVFEKDYKLMSLADLEQFILANKHLPEIPSAKEIEENGADTGELLKKQMQKIEELVLYAIDQNKKLEAQNKKIEELQKEVSTLKAGK